jgi:precorrin-6B methylase 2
MGVDNFHRRLNNVNFNIEKNGELRVLQKLAKIDPKCIFDVGANKGDWSQIVSKLYPSCTIHAFEIVPSTYEELTRNTKELHNVIPNNFGLSNEEGLVYCFRVRDRNGN